MQVDDLNHFGFFAAGDFTVDQTLVLSTGLYVQAAGNIAVADPLTLPRTAALTLNAGGTLSIDAPIAVRGAGAVRLDAGFDTTTVPGTSLTELSFGTDDGLSFGATNFGASLAINGTSYTLLYSPGDLAAINTNAGVQGDYALADLSISPASPAGRRSAPTAPTRR